MHIQRQSKPREDYFMMECGVVATEECILQLLTQREMGKIKNVRALAVMGNLQGG